FFFSSRRRHTRFSRDWSSDVCSSDLLHQQLAIEIESICTDVYLLRFFVVVPLRRHFKEILHSNYQFFHAEWFAHIIIRAFGESVDDVLGLSPCGEKNDGNLVVHLPDLLGNGKSVLIWKHHIEHTDVGL